MIARFWEMRSSPAPVLSLDRVTHLFVFQFQSRRTRTTSLHLPLSRSQSRPRFLLSETVFQCKSQLLLRPKRWKRSINTAKIYRYALNSKFFRIEHTKWYICSAHSTKCEIECLATFKRTSEIYSVFVRHTDINPGNETFGHLATWIVWKRLSSTLWCYRVLHIKRHAFYTWQLFASEKWV